MKKSIIAAAAALLIAAMAFAGCSAASSSSSSQPDAQAGWNADALLGKVTDIDGTSVTLAMGDMSMPDGADMQKPDGTPPADMQKPDGADMQKPDGTPPAGSSASDGQGGAQRPDGTQGGGKGGGFTENGETLTITLGDGVTISKMGSDTACTAADIAAGDILALTYSGDTLTEVTIMSGGARGDRPASSGSAAADADSDAADSAAASGSSASASGSAA